MPINCKGINYKIILVSVPEKYFSHLRLRFQANKSNSGNSQFINNIDLVGLIPILFLEVTNKNLDWPYSNLMTQNCQMFLVKLCKSGKRILPILLM